MPSEDPSNRSAAPPNLLPILSSTATAVDPVCGMGVAVTSDSWSAEAFDRTVYFCCRSCRDRFRRRPDRWLDAAGRPRPAAVEPMDDPPPAPPGAAYLCPMHPEVVADAPGDCPHCGMALEPSLPPTTDDFDATAPLRRRFFWCAAATVPLVVAAMGPMAWRWLFSTEHPHAAGWLGWLQAALATPIVFWGGRPYLERGVRSVTLGSWNMFTLISLGVVSAYLAGTAVLLLGDWLPLGLVGPHGEAPLYFESAAVIITLVALGQWLEERARRRTGDAVRA
ncbi:MAG: heavy metal-binding domain-containing protein, partial [Planctomycetia bacterium]